uniref:histidine kinase n=1 Tax=Mesoaciditoga lauensis TaxID=1495039 RepID=A0A7V3VSL0_9BACT
MKETKLSTKFLLYVIIPVAIMGILMAFGEKRIFENRFDSFAKTQFMDRNFYVLDPYFSKARLNNIDDVKRATMLEIIVSFIFAFGTSLAISIILAELFQRKIAQSLTELSTAVKKIENGEKIDLSKSGFSSEISDLGKKIESLSVQLNLRTDTRKAMTSSVYHEIMTPLGVVKMQLEALKDKMIPYDDELIDKMILNVDHISEVLKDLKNIEGREIEYSIESFDVSKDVEEVGKSFIAIFESRKISFETRTESLKISADRRRFRQVIFNLLSNAVKYTPSGGKVLIDIKNNEIDLSNTFDGSLPDPSTYGTGLKFVKNFCEHHGFKFFFDYFHGGVVAKIIFR